MKVGKKYIFALATTFVVCGMGLWLTGFLRGNAPNTVTAALGGDLKLLQKLQRQGMSLNYHDPRKFFNWTPLMAAVYGSQSNMVAYLLQQGVDLEATNGDGTALQLAVERADDDAGLAIVQMLISAGAKTNSINASYVRLSPQKDRLEKILKQSKPAQP